MQMKNLKATVKLKSVALTMRGEDVDGLTLDGAMELDHFRLFKTHNMIDSGYSNAISWEEFCEGFYLKTFDLTTSGDASIGYQQPAVKTGHSRVAIKFDSQTTTSLTLLAYSEYAAELTIRKGPQGMIVETNYIK